LAEINSSHVFANLVPYCLHFGCRIIGDGSDASGNFSPSSGISCGAYSPNSPRSCVRIGVGRRVGGRASGAGRSCGNVVISIGSCATRQVSSCISRAGGGSKLI
jgi:hypothetical protein